MSAGWKFKAKNPIDNVGPSFLGFLSSSTWLDNPERDIVAFRVDFVIHSLHLSFLLTLIRVPPVHKFVFCSRKEGNDRHSYKLVKRMNIKYNLYIYISPLRIISLSKINSRTIRIGNDLDTNSRVIDHLDKACRILHLAPCSIIVSIV